MKTLHYSSTCWNFFCCLIFQTLQDQTLQDFLPVGIARGAYHLNVANPLWTGFSDNVDDKFRRPKKRHIFKTFLSSSGDIAKTNQDWNDFLAYLQSKKFSTMEIVQCVKSGSHFLPFQKMHLFLEDGTRAHVHDLSPQGENQNQTPLDAVSPNLATPIMITTEGTDVYGPVEYLLHFQGHFTAGHFKILADRVTGLSMSDITQILDD